MENHNDFVVALFSVIVTDWGIKIGNFKIALHQAQLVRNHFGPLPASCTVY